MKHSEKTYDSFQDELKDYIQVQKARGLEPKICFRKMREDYWETFEYKQKVDPRLRYRMSDQRFPSEAVQTHPRSFRIPQTLENRLPQWLPAHDSRLRLDSRNYYRLARDCSLEEPAALSLSPQDYSCNPYSGESALYRHVSSENSTSDHVASHQQVHRKRRRHPEEGRGRTGEERPEQKKRKRGDEMDSDKDQSVQRNKAEAGTGGVSAEKLKNRKEKKSRDLSSKKEERKRRKEKKCQDPERTEEEMLWDQSILGF